MGKKLLGKSGLVLSCNPVIGCTFNCPYCYARMVNNHYHYISDFSIPHVKLETLHKIHTRTPKTFFMNSMSDVADWSFNTKLAVFHEIQKYSNNKYLFLTKRPQKLDGLDTSGLNNTWIGVTVTNIHDIWRIDYMKQHINAANYHIQFEPLLGDVGKIDLTGINQIVIGAETKVPGKIVPKIEWIENIINQANKCGTAVWLRNSLEKVVGKNNLRQDCLPFLTSF